MRKKSEISSSIPAKDKKEVPYSKYTSFQTNSHGFLFLKVLALINITYISLKSWCYDVMVSTLDLQSSDPSSSFGRTCLDYCCIL